MNFSDNYIIHNCIAIALFCGALFFCFWLWNHRLWGERIKTCFKKPFAFLGLTFTVLFFFTAFLDSVSWKSQSLDSTHLKANSQRTALDRIFQLVSGHPEWEYKERATSAPLAEVELHDKSIALKHRHIFGTNVSGVDTAYAVLKGIRPAVMIGTFPLFIAIPLAVILGVIAGYKGGLIDEIVVYIYTTLSSIPGLLLLLAILSVLPKSLFNICMALSLTAWIALCRLVRAETLKLREMEYIQAAKCFGVTLPKILMQHILPNVTHIILITAILTFTSLVLSESILSYLGQGMAESWGTMIASAKTEIAQSPIVWWNLTFASMALFLLVLSVNVVGDALRDALDPRRGGH